MTTHTVKTIASGEYSCSCGAIWDRDEGDECPTVRYQVKPSAELPGMWEPSDLSGGETDQSANSHVIQYAEGIFVWFDEVGLPGGVETSAAAAHTALGEYARSLDAMPTGCKEHMTAVCPMRADSARLDFLLHGYRKVVVECLPGNRREVYVEEGFMADRKYPAVTHKGDWASGSPVDLDLKRRAIDAALAAKP